MVAKSYQQLQIIGKPFTKNDRTYIKVLTKKGIEKEVRWYDEDEYYTIYPDQRPPIQFFPKKAFGFEPKGFTYIFKGKEEDLEWLKRKNPFQFATHLGWFLRGNYELPEDIPPTITAIKLYWIEVSEEDEMYDAETVKMICDRKRDD